MIRLMESIEEQDDVQHVYANFDIDEKEFAGCRRKLSFFS